MSELKLVFAPWGVDDFGEDVWTLENALIFGVQKLLDALPPLGFATYADLYGQLSGNQVVQSRVREYSEADLHRLALRAPDSTDAVVDGLIHVRRDPATGSLREATIAPRLLLLPSMEFAAPEAFVFSAFSPDSDGRSALGPISSRHVHELAFNLAEALLDVLGIEIPSFLDASLLESTKSWDAEVAFLKAKRLAKTAQEKLGYYRQAVRLDPAFFWARFNLAGVLKTQEDYAGARREFMAAAKVSGDDPTLLSEIYFELGLCSIYIGDTKTARNFWDEAMRYQPDSPTLLVNIAGTYEQEEDWAQAVALHERALQIAPTYHKAIVSLARLKAALGKLDEAIALYEQALEIKPNDALRHAIVGGCYVATGDRGKARHHLEHASRLDPPRPTKPPTEGDEPAAGEYARQELAKLDGFSRA